MNLSVNCTEFAIFNYSCSKVCKDAPKISEIGSKISEIGSKFSQVGPMLVIDESY